MKKALVVSLLALSSVLAYGAEVSQNCYCPTCPNHQKPCANTGNQFPRNASNNKVEAVKAPAQAGSSKGSTSKGQ